MQLDLFHLGLRSRGPDTIGYETIEVGGPIPRRLTFASSLLQLRGSTPAPTPHKNHDTGDILLFNGEIFYGIDVPLGENDGAHLLTSLSGCSTSSDIIALLSRLRGPWAIIYWHALSSTLWIGRDVLGRRSLLVNWSTRDCRGILTSVGPIIDDVDKGRSNTIRSSNYQEIPPGIYKVGLGQHEVDNIDNIQAIDEDSSSIPSCISPIPWANPSITRTVKAFNRLDSHIYPPESAMHAPLPSSHPLVQNAVDGVLKALCAAVDTRCRCIDAIEHHQDAINDVLPPARIMILFSGGVDSTLLALLTHLSLVANSWQSTHRGDPSEPIDLVSICFAHGTSSDRQSAIYALQELKKVAPERNWRLIGMDCLLESDIDAATPRLLQLLHPADTVMDLNIGAALWLAASGSGYLLENDGSGGRKGQTYKSKAKTVFLGHGADELFGGYGRHRTKFRESGWNGLAEELALDVKRLWKRNLGRDDRLVADRGREARHPFLDEGVVVESLKHPLCAMVDLRLPPGEGDKRVLRECARTLGLRETAARLKRAIQFGTKLAQAANKRDFGGTRKANARSAGGVKLADLSKTGG